jgi:hypothetical protein
MSKYIVALAMFALGVAVGHAMRGPIGLVTNAHVEQIDPFGLMSNAKKLPTEATVDPF